MILGVPIPDYDPSKDEEQQMVKINGAIHEEVLFSLHSNSIWKVIISTGQY